MSIKEKQTGSSKIYRTEYQLMFALALYTGMRPNEFETAKREGKFIVAINSKRKGGKMTLAWRTRKRLYRRI